MMMPTSAMTAAIFTSPKVCRLTAIVNMMQGTRTKPSISTNAGFTVMISPSREEM